MWQVPSYKHQVSLWRKECPKTRFRFDALPAPVDLRNRPEILKKIKITYNVYQKKNRCSEQVGIGRQLYNYNKITKACSVHCSAKAYKQVLTYLSTQIYLTILKIKKTQKMYIMTQVSLVLCSRITIYNFSRFFYETVTNGENKYLNFR